MAISVSAVSPIGTRQHSWLSLYPLQIVALHPHNFITGMVYLGTAPAEQTIHNCISYES